MHPGTAHILLHSETTLAHGHLDMLRGCIAQAMCLIMQEMGHCAGRDMCHWAHVSEEVRLNIECIVQGKLLYASYQCAQSS